MRALIPLSYHRLAVSRRISGLPLLLLWSTPARHQSDTADQHVYDNPALRLSDADVIKCVVVAGRAPIDPIKLRGLEVFRNACKDVDIITFDELLAKLEFLETELTPKPEPDIF